MLNDDESSYEDLLKRSGKASMNIGTTRSLCIKLHKTITNLNPEFMKNLFKVSKTNRVQRRQYQLNANPKI